MGSSRKHRKTRKNNGKKGGRIADIPNNAPVNFQQDEYSSRFFTNMGTAKRIREEVGPQFMDGGVRVSGHVPTLYNSYLRRNTNNRRKSGTKRKRNNSNYEANNEKGPLSKRVAPPPPPPTKELLLESSRIGDLAGVRAALDGGVYVNATNYTFKYDITSHTWYFEEYSQCTNRSYLMFNSLGEGHSDTALIIATKNNHYDIVQELLRRGAYVNFAGHENETALFVAAKTNNQAILRLLLDNHAAINAINEHGDTPLIEASKYGHIEIVRDLIKAGADLTMIEYNSNPLVWAIENGHIDIVRELLNAGIKINWADEEYNNLQGDEILLDALNALDKILTQGRRADPEGKKERTSLQIILLIIEASNKKNNNNDKIPRTDRLKTLDKNVYDKRRIRNRQTAALLGAHSETPLPPDLMEHIGRKYLGGRR